MPKSCLTCGHCKTKTELRPLKRGSRRFKHNHPVVQDKLNSKFMYGKVYCAQGMWTKDDGSEFTYKKFNIMMRNAATGPKGHLTTAEKCLRYER